MDYFHLSTKLDNLAEDIADIKQDVKHIKAITETDITGLKIAQAGCNSKWSVIKGILSWGGLSTIVATLYAYMIGQHK